MADNDIINFYKKVTPEEPLKEQTETPEPVVSEAIVVPVPESSDPFDKFLFNLAEKLKTEKKITEQQQQQFNERVVQPTTDPTDPFAKFLESFAGLVKQDENVNKEENIKEATIDFINKLKNDDFFDYKKEESKEEVKSEPKKKSKKYLPPKFVKKIEKIEEEEPVIEQATEPESEVKEQEPPNQYVKELQTTDKKKSKIEDKISGLSDIKTIVAQQVQEQLSKYPNLGFTGGGGGTNAVQYAQGGVMDGNLTVNGTLNASTLLSGGINLATIFSTTTGGGGGGFADRFVSGPSQFILDPDGKLHPLDDQLLTLQSESSALSAFTRVVLSPYGFFAYDNNSNSITFDSISDDIVITSQDLYEWTFNSEGKLIGPSGTLAVSGNVDVTSKLLSGGVDLADIFITSAEESQTLAYDTQTELLSITRGNFISLSSLNDKSYVNSNFLPLSGGTVYGKLEVANLVVTSGISSVSASNLHVTDPLIYIAEGNRTNLYDIGLVGAFDDGIYQHTGLVRFTTPYNHWALFDGLTAEPLSAHIPREDPSFKLADLHLGGVYGTKILSGGVDLKDIFLTTETDSQTLTYTESSAELSISNGNTVTLSALSGQKFNQSLNTTDNVQFNQVNIGGAGELDIVNYGLRYGMDALTLDDRFLRDANGQPAIGFGNDLIIEFYKPFNFNTGPNPAQAVADSRTSLGLGSADNVEFNQVNANVYLSGGTNLLNLLSSSGGGGGDPAVNTVVYTYSATWIDTSTVVQNNSASWAAGGGGAVEKRFDFVTTGGIDYSYSGTAPQYTIETSPTWKLIRLTYNNNGTISNQASAIDSWTGRLTATYV